MQRVLCDESTSGAHVEFAKKQHEDKYMLFCREVVIRLRAYENQKWILTF